MEAEMTYDVFEVETRRAREEVEIAHAVSAKVASELSGLPVAMLEDQIAEYGETGILNCSLEGDAQELMVRRTCDES
jgi:hypothetical protein